MTPEEHLQAALARNDTLWKVSLIFFLVGAFRGVDFVMVVATFVMIYTTATETALKRGFALKGE